MSQRIMELTVQLQAEERDPEETSLLTAQLQAALGELDLESIRRPTLPASHAPDGSKSGALEEVGKLIVSLGGSAGLLTSVVKIALAKIQNPRVKTIRLEINGDSLEIRHPNSDKDNEIVRQWIDRHGDTRESHDGDRL